MKNDKGIILFTSFVLLYIYSLLPAVCKELDNPADLAEPVKEESLIAKDVTLYLEAMTLEKQKNYTDAATKYQASLKINPQNTLSFSRLQKLAPHLLTDHRKLLNKYPGYTIKANPHSKTAVADPIWFDDVMTGYLVVFNHKACGNYAVFSLKSRHIKHLMYLLVKEDETWAQYPLVSLKGVTRVGNVLVYHQQNEELQAGFANQLVREYLRY